MPWDRLKCTSLLHLWRFFSSFKLHHHQNCRATERAAAAYLTYWEWKSVKERIHFTSKCSTQINAMPLAAWWKVENGNAIWSCPYPVWPSSISVPSFFLSSVLSLIAACGLRTPVHSLPSCSPSHSQIHLFTWSLPITALNIWSDSSTVLLFDRVIWVFFLFISVFSFQCVFMS